jgi:hypothetical protein
MLHLSTVCTVSGIWYLYVYDVIRLLIHFHNCYCQLSNLQQQSKVIYVQ